MHGLKRLRVIDDSSEIASLYFSKLLADAGADAIQLEVPRGDPLRTGSAPGADLGGRGRTLFRYLNGSKRSVVGVLDQARPGR